EDPYYPFPPYALPLPLLPIFPIPPFLWNLQPALACNPQKSIRRTLSVMNLKNAFYFIFSLLLMAGIALAQQAAPPAAPPPMPDEPVEAPEAFSLFIGGGSFLGVYAEDVNKENMARYGLRDARGVAITQVIKDSPAEKAGLRKDDVIVRFEDDSVTSVRKLNRLVSEVAPDQTVKLRISRGGGEQEVAVTIGKRNQSFNAMGDWQGLKGLDKIEGL